MKIYKDKSWPAHEAIKFVEKKYWLRWECNIYQKEKVNQHAKTGKFPYQVGITSSSLKVANVSGRVVEVYMCQHRVHVGTNEDYDYQWNFCGVVDYTMEELKKVYFESSQCFNDAGKKMIYFGK